MERPRFGDIPVIVGLHVIYGLFSRTVILPPQMWMAKPDALNPCRVEKSQPTMPEGGYGTWRHRLRPKRAVERSLKLKNDSTSTLSLQTYIMWWQKVDVFIFTYIHIGDNFLAFARNSNNLYLYYIDFFYIDAVYQYIPWYTPIHLGGGHQTCARRNDLQ